MATPEHHYDPYDRLAPFYDWMARSLLLPFGGEDRFRQRVVDALALEPGHHVLELGCGTGAMTRRMLDRGARVTAVDLAEPMLERARARAPEASFVVHDVLTLDLGETVDAVLLAFVLHEMDADTRAGALATARRHLAPGGRLVVLEFADAAPFPIGPVFRAYLKVAEPELAREVLGSRLTDELADAGFAVDPPRWLAAGTARVLVGLACDSEPAGDITG